MCADHTKIFLTGFMGAGKSTAGKLLAVLLGCVFVDLDNVIVEREQRSIADIFAIEGEDYFRECETALLDSLNCQQPTVYATGGGIVVRAENRQKMHNLGTVVYLNANWNSLLQRLEDSVDRPLVKSERDWQAVYKLWHDRQQDYMDADFVIETDGLTPEQVAEQLVRLLKPGESV